jgi:hypothetical protein
MIGGQIQSQDLQQFLLVYILRLQARKMCSRFD